MALWLDSHHPVDPPHPMAWPWSHCNWRPFSSFLWSSSSFFWSFSSFLWDWLHYIWRPFCIFVNIFIILMRADIMIQVLLLPIPIENCRGRATKKHKFCISDVLFPIPMENCRRSATKTQFVSQMESRASEVTTRCPHLVSSAPPSLCNVLQNFVLEQQS